MMGGPEKPANRRLQWLRMILLCCFQPFFYGAATRVPLIYVGLYGYFGLGMPWWRVGLMIATYQLCRAIANLLIPLFGKVVYHFLGVSIGLVGYAIQSQNRGEEEVTFWFAVGMIGLSEVITCMQHYVKVEYVPFGVPVLRQRLRLQYACNVAGTAVGFIVAGFLMDLHIATNPTDDTSSSRKDAYWGIALQASELLSTFAYMALVKFWPSESAPTHDFAQLLFASDAEKALVMGKEKDAKPIEVGEITLKYLNRDPPSSEEHAISLPANDEVAANEIASLAALGVNITKRIDPKELERVLSKVKGEKDSGVPWINYMVVVTFAVQALCIGTILSTAPILLFSEYYFDVSFIGLVFGGGEVLGTIALFFFVPVSSQMAVRKYFPGPLNMLITVGMLGTLALLLAIHTLGSSIVFIVLIMGLNDFGTALTAEAQGATVAPQHYSRVNSLSNIARRLGNTATAALGPIMFGVAYYLPFVTFGALSILWIFVMAFAFHIRGKQVAAIINGNKKAEGGLQFYLRSHTFITAELHAREKYAEQNA